MPLAKSYKLKAISYTQHTGLGKKLMAETEKIVKNQSYKKIAVISGIGVRHYYKKLGYRLKNEYMIKRFKD
jgi:elongator complex protein 3